ncbi:hypothetical protein PACTADRAFT_1183 [Pachysolen tannophilus NRRL Y-2460]|uniref:E3 ubiquitin-protein ligase PEP5 n=1 Tax=Pachysolen tannophilus NRRL Y-2460 TaxID=669874 RepID=A0A1E4TXT2_PACTA|nr:hypothetical protein PACTADRAFT_1183 [Pachysolen tannophilus NRRL Y-2460]
MSLSSYRQFQFFDITPIRDPNYGSITDSLYSNPTLSSICSTPKYLIINSNITIKIIDFNSYRLITQFDAYDLSYSIIKLLHIKKTNLIVSIAEKLGSPSSLKIWDLDRILNKNADKKHIDEHSFHSQVLVTNDNNNYPITSFHWTSDFNLLAFGFGNGNVILIRGDLIHDRGSRQRLIYENNNDPITGVFFQNNGLLFITTLNKILTIPTNGKTTYNVLEKNFGCELNCCALNFLKQELIIGLENCIIFYNERQKIDTIQLDLPKKRIYNFNKNYLLIVSSLTITTTKLVIFDYKNKQIIFNLSISSTVKEIFEWNNELFLLSNDGMLYKLTEKPITKELKIINQRNLYPISLKLADQYKLDKSIINDIHLKYGEFLYEKQDYDESMDQFLICLNKNSQNTSEIINKFKDNKNLNNLIRYLIKMFNLNLTNKNHLTLLMCCYIKLKDFETLEKFIDDKFLNKDHNHENRMADYSEQFDLNTVIQLCRDSNSYNTATKLAIIFNELNLVIDILINDVFNFSKTIVFLKSLKINELLSVLLFDDNSNLVKILLKHLPIEMTKLLIEIFTGNFKTEKIDDLNLFFTSSEKEHIHDTNKETNNKEDESYPILQSYKTFLSYLGVPPSPTGDDQQQQEQEQQQQKQEEDQLTYLPPKPRLIFSSFINNQNEFVIFLEACLLSYDKFKGDPSDKKDLIITLFEIYLNLYNSEQNIAKKQEWSKKARNLVKYNDSELVDINALLLICQLNAFDLNDPDVEEDEFLVSNSVIDLYRSSAVDEDLNKCIKILHKYGDRENELYRLAIKFYSSSEKIYSKITKEEFDYVLNKIKKYKVLTPLELIQILSLNSVSKLGLVKNFLLDYVAITKRELNNNDKLIRSYTEENGKLKANINTLLNDSVTVQSTKCYSCGLNLELPIIHFKCKHSYHLRCINESELDDALSISIANGSTKSVISSWDHSNINKYKCPKCINELDEIIALRQHQEEVSERNDLFLNALNEDVKNDRFKVISDFIGRGGMEDPKYFVN